MAISKGAIIMVFVGSYQPNLDDNIGAGSLAIHYIDTDRYTWVPLPTTSHALNEYRSELTGLYEILSLLESLCKIY